MIEVSKPHHANDNTKVVPILFAGAEFGAAILIAPVRQFKDLMNEKQIYGMTVTMVSGCGHQRGRKVMYRGTEVSINLLPKVKVEIVLSDSKTEEMIPLMGYIPFSTMDEIKGSTGERTYTAAAMVKDEYDPNEVSYEDLLAVFWNNHNPTTLNQQGPDIGEQYRSSVFFHTPEQESSAKNLKEKLQNAALKQFGKKIVTEIVPASTFYKAEEYHQRYLEKNGMAHCSSGLN